LLKALKCTEEYKRVLNESFIIFSVFSEPSVVKKSLVLLKGVFDEEDIFGCIAFYSI